MPGHDRGQMLVDVATMLAGGGEAIADIDTLRHQEQVLARRTPRPPTVWRALDELTPVRLRRVEDEPLIPIWLSENYCLVLQKGDAPERPGTGLIKCSVYHTPLKPEVLVLPARAHDDIESV